MKWLLMVSLAFNLYTAAAFYKLHKGDNSDIISVCIYYHKDNPIFKDRTTNEKEGNNLMRAQAVRW